MKSLRILHLEDSWADAFLVEQALWGDGVDAEMLVTRRASDFLSAMAMEKPDLIFLDNGVPGFSGTAALEAARNLIPDVPVIVVSGSTDENQIRDRMKSGACDYVSKNRLWTLPAAVRRAISRMDNGKADQGPTNL